MGILNKAINGIGGLVGLGGGQGQHYSAGDYNSKAKYQQDNEAELLSDTHLNQAMQDYAQGKISLADAMKVAGNVNSTSAGFGQLSTSPIVGSMVASDMVRNDPLSKGLLGEGGALERALGEEKQLASRGYSLQPEDYEAYGQASGNIARQFGSQEQSLSKALANRGLSAGASGVANQQFSGMYGNKFEQLAQMQRQIADDRMNRNMERLNQTRNFAANLGGLGQDALNSQFNRNLAGQKNRQDMLSGQRSADTAEYGAIEQARQAQEVSRKGSEKASLMDAIGAGVGSAVTAAPSVLMGMPPPEKKKPGNQAGGGTSGYGGVLA